MNSYLRSRLSMTMLVMFVQHISQVMAAPVAMSDEILDVINSSPLLVSEYVRQNDINSAPTDSSDSVFTGWELTGGTADKKASIKLAPRNNSYGLAIGVSAPLEDGAKKLDFYSSNTNAFANSTTLTISVRRSILSSGFAIDKTKAEAILMPICKSNPTQFATGAGIVGLTQDGCNSLLLDSLLTQSSFDFLTDEKRMSLLPLLDSATKPVFMYGLTGSVGYEKYNYFSGAGLESAESTETPWGVSGYFRTLWDKRGSLTLSFEYQKGYKAQDKETRCPVEPGLAVLVCKTNFSDSPREKNNRNVKLSGRYIIAPDGWFGGGIAVSPEVVYNFENEEYSFQLPLYLVTEGEKKIANGISNLTGGIRYDYESGKRGSSVGVFIGSKFSLE